MGKTLTRSSSWASWLLTIPRLLEFGIRLSSFFRFFPVPCKKQRREQSPSWASALGWFRLRFPCRDAMAHKQRPGESKLAWGYLDQYLRHCRCPQSLQSSCLPQAGSCVHSVTGVGWGEVGGLPHLPCTAKCTTTRTQRVQSVSCGHLSTSSVCRRVGTSTGPGADSRLPGRQSTSPSGCEGVG